MTQAKPRFQTIKEYAALEPSELPEGQYELVNGEIIELPPESDPNVEIAIVLAVMLAQVTSPRLIRRGTEIFVSSRTVTSCYPDLMILSEEGRTAIRGARRSAVTPEMPPPKLVIEVVSPGEPGSDNYNRDYIEKPREYAARSIPEYWIVDPGRAVVLVLTLQGDRYQTQEFRNGDRLVSPMFPNLQLTAAQILEAGA